MLHSLFVNQLMCTIDPAEARWLFHSIRIVKLVILNRLSTFQFDPAFTIVVSMESKPFAEVFSIINLQYIPDSMNDHIITYKSRLINRQILSYTFSPS